jgi:GST-like protein
MIELYACGSPNVFKVLLMLGETGLPFTVKRVNIANEEQFAPEFTALNPNSKLPVIVDSDGPEGRPHTVFESGAILIYLADKTGRLLPTAPAARSEALQWLMWQMGGVGPMFGQALHFKFLAPAGSDYGRVRYLTEVQRLYNVAEARLKRSPWLGGTEYSIADIAAWPWLGKYPKTLEIDMTTRPHVAAWIAKIEQRPGQQAIAEAAKHLYKGDLVAQKEAKPDSLDRFYLRGRWARA